VAADGDRAGEDRMLDAAPARRLEAVVHALDIELESIVGSEFANEVGKVDQPLSAGFLNHPNDVVELGHVATPDGDFVAIAREGSPGTGDIDVHAGDVMAGSDQKRDHSPADEACTAHYHDGHAFPPRCRAPIGSTGGATLPVDGGARKWSEAESRAASPAYAVLQLAWQPIARARAGVEVDRK